MFVWGTLKCEKGRLSLGLVFLLLLLLLQCVGLGYFLHLACVSFCRINCFGRGSVWFGAVRIGSGNINIEIALQGF